MNNFARRVECALRFSVANVKQILKNFAEHFGINGDFAFGRLILIDCEVVPVKNVKDTVRVTPFDVGV